MKNEIIEALTLIEEEDNRTQRDIEIIKQAKYEIERLKEENKKYNKWIESLNKDNHRLNNIINKGIEAINVYQNEKTLSVRYEDLKRIRGILQGSEFDLQRFEEYLQELRGDGSNDSKRDV